MEVEINKSETVYTVSDQRGEIILEIGEGEGEDTPVFIRVF